MAGLHARRRAHAGVAIGVILLHLDEPERLIAALPEPLLVADEPEREGNVPNVVYSCGSMIHGQTVVLPYGCSDPSARIAVADLSRSGRPSRNVTIRQSSLVQIADYFR